MSTGAELRDLGFRQLELATGAAGQTWHTRARSYITSLPLGASFTADDLRRGRCEGPNRMGRARMKHTTLNRTSPHYRKGAA